MPNAFAPLSVAIVKTSFAPKLSGLPVNNLACNAAVRISPNIFKSLLLAAPSVPSATFKPKD